MGQNQICQLKGKLYQLISKQKLADCNATLFGYVLIGTGISGYSQKRFWGDVTPNILWIVYGIVGLLMLLRKEYRQYRSTKIRLYWFDALFVIPAFTIPWLAIPPDWCMILLLSYESIFILVYYRIFTKSHKK